MTTCTSTADSIAATLPPYPLHRAVLSGDIKKLKALLDDPSNRLDINERDHKGNPPLHLAIHTKNRYGNMISVSAYPIWTIITTSQRIYPFHHRTNDHITATIDKHHHCNQPLSHHHSRHQHLRLSPRHRYHLVIIPIASPLLANRSPTHS